MTTEEVARASRVTRYIVTRWIREGRLQVIRIRVGERAVYRIRRSAFLKFLGAYVREG